VKKSKFYLSFFIASAAFVVFAIMLISCPPLYEDPSGSIVKVNGELTLSKWNDTLFDIYSKGRYVTLDLSACTPATSSDNAVLKHTNEDGNDFVADPLNIYNDYYQFDASSGNKNGKNLIRSIILPNVATMINNASNNIDIESIEDADDDETEMFAFRHFTNLRSISGKKVSLIGTFAFYNCKTLAEVDFPEAVIVMQFSFFNCTSLKKIRFESAKYINQSAFENCSGLEKAEFISAEYIEHRAFKNCTNITEAYFPRARAVRPEAFRNCAKLKTARFHADPWPRTTGNGHPLMPIGGGVFTTDTLAFHDNAFRGCKSLEILDIRNAWNVYFAGGALADTGTHLELHLFDDNGTKSWGHPQLDLFLGDPDTQDPDDKGKVTLKTITIRATTVPSGQSQILKTSNDQRETGIVSDIENRYDKITVTVIRGPA